MFGINENHWFIAKHHGSKITKLVYKSCYGIVVLKNRGHSIKVFALMSSQVATFSLVI